MSVLGIAKYSIAIITQTVGSKDVLRCNVLY